MQEKIIQKIEAILFYLAEPVSIDYITKVLEIKRDGVMMALNELEKNLQLHGLRLVTHDDQITLVTAPEFSDIIEKIIKDERERELGRAGIETLSIVAYKGPVSRREIDYIRGVNSQFALRNLLLRGLIERKTNKNDERIMMYTITGDTVRHLGLSKIAELPEYENMRQLLEVNPEEAEENED